MAANFAYCYQDCGPLWQALQQKLGPDRLSRVRWSAQLAYVTDDVLHRAVPGELDVVDDCAVAEPDLAAICGSWEASTIVMSCSARRAGHARSGHVSRA